MSLHLTQIRLSFGGDEVLSDVSAIEKLCAFFKPCGYQFPLWQCHRVGNEPFLVQLQGVAPLTMVPPPRLG
jgi:hypothetical protein